MILRKTSVVHWQCLCSLAVKERAKLESHKVQIQLWTGTETKPATAIPNESATLATPRLNSRCADATWGAEEKCRDK